MAKNGSRILTFLISSVAAGQVLSAAAATDAVSFDRDIRPILSENCFTCHGPDEGKRKSGLRLDRREDALQPAKSGERAIVPGNSAKSALIARVTTTDEDDHMPPPSTGKKLSAHQIDLLRRWIDADAPWQMHWAFIPPVRPALPPVTDASWPRNEIDYFVGAHLDQESLKPSLEADKTTLIRRASFDLTGLPPTVEEVDAFLADGTADAYEKVVDRLMTYPSFGEHQARYWLDSARYADTHGYHIDSKRDMWKYRDWVIQAFNDNKPFDQFTIDQLAGDLEPNSTVDQKIASGYVRANMTTGEGGVIEEDYRAKYTFDRVETTGAMFMGMTLMCARCHTHKYDPIQHREYYSLYAIFNQLADPVMDENKPNPAPTLRVPSRDQAERMAWLKQHLQGAEAKLARPMPHLDEAQAAWQRAWHSTLSNGWTALQATQAFSTLTNGAQLRCLEDQVITVEGPSPQGDVHELLFRPEAAEISALRLEVLASESIEQSGRAAEGRFWLSEFEADLVVRPAKAGDEPKTEKLSFTRVVADAEVKDREIGKVLDGKPESGWQVPSGANPEPHFAVFVPPKPVRVPDGAELRVRLRYPPASSNAVLGRFRISMARSDELKHALHPPELSPWQVLGPLKAESATAALATTYPPEQAIDLKQKLPGVRDEVGWSEQTNLEDGKPNLLVQDLHGIHGVRYLYRTMALPASRTMEVDLRADGLFKLWVNGELAAERAHEEKPGEGPLSATIQLQAGENRLLLKIVTVQGASHFTFSPDLGSPDALTGEIAAILSTSATLTSDSTAKARRYFRRQHSADYRTTDNALVRWRQEQETIDRAIPSTMIAKESDTPRETFILLRGEYDKKGEKVQPGVPAIFPPLPPGAPTNRLGLAKWLVDPSHPLTARVIVNRFWQQFFGVGLVKTTEDFGMQGEHPSNPQLLDWLATEFIRSGWDMKGLQRLMMTSATYRQSSRASQELIARDPENRLLARGPRFRMDAEMIRDTALSVSGLLVNRPGGESVRPYEPPGLWEAVSFNGSQKYVQDMGQAQYRRSMYTFWKRQSPPPAMLIFDAPSREACTLRRSRSNTPLQALTLLNDPQFVEASRAFAQRILLEGGATIEARAAFAFRLVTARAPKPEEVAILCRLVQEQSEAFNQDRSAAQQLLAVGSFRARADLDAAELATWTTVASLLLNLDETMTKS